jgi:ribosomal protein S18 acetylase RimI-like enzyme
MTVHIRPFHHEDLDAIASLSLLAWEPVFAAWEQILGPELYPLAIFPDWRKSQKEAVEKACLDETMTTWVAEVEHNVAGFLVLALNDTDKVGEVYMLAVHPDYQNRGIGTELNLMALRKMTEAGMKLAVVGTGGDDGHAPARRAYEKVGYTGLPAVRYYKALQAD